MYRENDMTLTREELEQARDFIYRELPRVLEKDPDFVKLVEGIIAEKFPRRDEFARLLDELTTMRHEQHEGFSQVNQRVDKLETGQDQLRQDVTGLRTGQDQLRQDVGNLYTLLDERTEMLRKELNDAISKLGRRWGLVEEDVLRQVVRAIVQDTYGDKVRELYIKGEQYDCVITNGQHILIEVTSRTTQKMIKRLQRKKALYTQQTGVEPARVILATAQIHLTVAQKLESLGFEVLQPDILYEEYDEE